jgi:hypothetical protein
MNYNSKFIGILIFIALIFCVSSVVSAAENSAVQSSGNDSSVQSASLSTQSPDTMDIINNSDLREEVITNLESNGVNTSVLQAAISVGNTEKVKNILVYYKDKLQAAPKNETSSPVESEAVKEKQTSKATEEGQTPVPVGTKSPLSPFTVLMGIGLAGCAVFLLKR